MAEHKAECAYVKVLVSVDTLPVAGIHTDGRGRSEHRARHAESRVSIQRPTVDVCLPTATGGEERQEQREGWDGDTEHYGKTEEEGSREEEGWQDGSGE